MIRNPLTGLEIEYLEVRTKRALEEFVVDNLMDYTVNSASGCDLDNLYKTIVEKVLIEDTYVLASEISDGKYKVSFEFESKDIWYIRSYAWDTVITIVENLMDNVIIPHIARGRSTCEN